MNAFELFNEHGKPCGIWCCGKCRKLVLNSAWHNNTDVENNTREEAEACCSTPVCPRCNQEYKRSAVGWVDGKPMCSKCRDAIWHENHAKRQALLLDTAKDVSDTYSGPVYCDGYTGDMGEGYFRDIDSAREYMHDEVIVNDDDSETYTGPEWAFACTSSVRRFDLGDAIENLCYDGYEDMGDNLTIPRSLTDAVAEFNRVNETALTVWETDYKRKVRVR